jgi:hypothetical protein
MSESSAFLPATALVAICVFIAREVMEFFRRRRSDARRRAAFRLLLARECELNNWAMRSIEHIATDLKGLKNPSSLSSFRIEYAKSGRIYACIDQDDDGDFGKTAVPRIHKEQLEKNLLDIATLDKELFEAAEPALTAAAELEHLREGILFHGSSESEVDRDHTDGFAEYALGELHDARSAISKLYQLCTGKELADVRLR